VGFTVWCVNLKVFLSCRCSLGERSCFEKGSHQIKQKVFFNWNCRLAFYSLMASPATKQAWTTTDDAVFTCWSSVCPHTIVARPTGTFEIVTGTSRCWLPSSSSTDMLLGSSAHTPKHKQKRNTRKNDLQRKGERLLPRTLADATNVRVVVVVVEAQEDQVFNTESHITSQPDHGSCCCLENLQIHAA